MFRSRCNSTLLTKNCYPIVRLWLLRLLVPLECHRRFIGDGEVSSSELAQMVGFNIDEDSPFDPIQVLKQLRQLHEDAETNASEVGLPEPLNSNITQLEKLGLSEVECWILAFAVIIKSERVLDDLADALGAALTTVATYRVLSILLAFPEEEIRQALSNQSVLTRTSLVAIDHDRDSLGRKLDLISRNFAGRLLNEKGDPVHWMRDMVLPSSEPELELSDYCYIKSTLDYLLPYLQHAIQTGRKGVNIFLHGIPGTGKTQLARVLAKELGSALFEIASEDSDGDPVLGENRLRAYQVAQVFFQSQKTLMLFDEVEDFFNDGNSFFTKSTAQTRKAWMNRILEENPAPTLWLGNTIHSIDPAFIRRFDWIIEVPIPPKAQRERIIHSHCGEILSSQSIKGLAANEDLAPAVISRAANVINTLRSQFADEELSVVMHKMLDTTLIAQGHAGLKQSEAFKLPDYYDPSLINCDTDVNQLVEGIRRQGSARLCFFGPPGTGKTAYSRWLAEQLDKPLHVKRGADLISKWVGGTEKNIASAFQDASEDNAVLLIDEVDSFLQDRQGSQHSWEITAINEMLTRLESYNGIFVASTNRLESLDPAALRRFDLKIKFNALNGEQSWRLLISLCHSLNIKEPDATYKAGVAKLDQLTPGDFAVIARQNRFRPIGDVQTLIAALEAEHELKTPYQRRAIGFV